MQKIKIIRFKQYGLILLFILFSSQNAAFSQTEDVIRVDTNLITVPTTVTDRDGRYIPDLKKENFQIFENTVEQDTAVFESVEQPITIFFLMDNSGSIKDYIPELVRTANTFTNQLRPNEQLIAATFSDGGRVKILFQATKIVELQKGIKIKADSGDKTTTTYDAVDYALKKMKKIQGRKAIILFSDAEFYGLSSTSKDNLRDAEEGESLIYTIRFGHFPSNPPSYANKKHYYERVEEIDSYMKDLAQKTGGRAFQIEETADLEKTFTSIAEELSRQYSLGYYPKETYKLKERRQIKVRVNIPNAAVRSRDGYIVGAPEKK